MKAVILLVIHDFVSVNQHRGKLIFGRNSGTKANMDGFDTGSLGTMRAHGIFQRLLTKPSYKSLSLASSISRKSVVDDLSR
ncbi:MAG: hypothetical protein KDA74_10830 [Planctomycetaceae bacterium]|jgi:hypothetical protein|nr:hypothetical protein [Planctomycetaceae bacterium]|tara:strand:- start:166 stop:408 length:243 start_codon:yes stop_codon:yes gene_type:complete